MVQPENGPGQQLPHLKLPQVLNLSRLFSYHQYYCKLKCQEGLVRKSAQDKKREDLKCEKYFCEIQILRESWEQALGFPQMSAVKYYHLSRAVHI